MKVLTYNVNFVFSNVAKIVEAIAESKAEIICLQETNRRWEEELLSHFGVNYPHHYFHNVQAAGGIAILSVHPIIEYKIIHTEEEVAGSWFSCLNAVVDISSSPLQIVNVHLRPPLPDSGQPMPWTMQQTSPVRQNELKFILSNLLRNKNEIATIFLGDFNENDNYSAVQYLKKAEKLNDALQIHCPNDHTHWWILFGFYYWKKRLDHVIYTPLLLNSTNCVVMKGYEGNGSDHLPVLTDFNFIVNNNNNNNNK